MSEECKQVVDVANKRSHCFLVLLSRFCFLLFASSCCQLLSFMTFCHCHQLAPIVLTFSFISDVCAIVLVSRHTLRFRVESCPFRSSFYHLWSYVLVLFSRSERL